MKRARFDGGEGIFLFEKMREDLCAGTAQSGVVGERGKSGRGQGRGGGTKIRERLMKES